MSKLSQIVGWTLEQIGILVDAIKGPSVTRIYHGSDKHHIETIHPTVDGYVDVTVVCKQVIYHTHYLRWWIPDSKRTVYEVCGEAIPELMEKVARVAPLFFVPVTYPMLSNPLLRWTDYPYVMAIQAYCTQVLDHAKAIQALNDQGE